MNLRQEHSHPPKLPLRFFRWFCHPELKKYIEGDLMELYEERVRVDGKRKADIKFVIDVLLLFRPGIIRPKQEYHSVNNYAMFKSYFKIGWRSLVKNKGYSFMNIIGLSVGITCVLLAVLYVKDERSFDDFHVNNPNLYRITTTMVERKGDKRMAKGGTGQVQGPAFKDAVPEILEYVRVMGGDIYEDVVANDKSLTLQTLYVDASFFDVFSFELVHGDREATLKEIHAAVITESVARRFFNRTDVVGEAIQLEANPSAERLGKPIVVTGVVRDLPNNSSIQFDMVLNMRLMQLSFDDQAWLNAYLGTFVVVHPQADLASVIQKFNAVYAIHASDQLSESKRDYGFDPLISYGLQRITDIHLNPLYNSSGNREAGVVNGSKPLFSYIFLGIAVFILVMAGINFINISIACSLDRSKEVGIRKINGGSKVQIIAQFFTESTIVCTCAFALSILFTQISLPVFNQLSNKAILFGNAFDMQLFLYFIIVLAVLVLITGLYPAYVLSNFRPLQVLYRKTKLSGRNLFGKALVVVQFSLAVALVIITTIYYLQMDYLRVKDLGYNPHQVIRSHIKGNRQYKAVEEFLRVELEKEPAVSVVSFGGERDASEVKVNDISIQAVHKVVDEYYLPALEIPIKAGRNFSALYSTDRSHGVIVNEAFVREAGLADPIGTQIKTDEYFDQYPKTIIGVVKDFHSGSLRERIQPMVMIMSDWYGGGIFLRIEKNKQQEAVAAFENAYRKAMPGAVFQYHYVDEFNAKEYIQEQRWQTIIGIATALSIVICCMGLFGLAHLATKQRTKEIGIRKVLGASITNITSLLSKDFMKLVIMGFMLALPVAWWGVSQWLENFAYKIELQWWMFVLAGSIAVAIAFLTVSLQTIKAALGNPVESLRSE